MAGPTLYVNGAGQASTAVGDVNNVYVNNAIKKLRARANGARVQAAVTRPPGASIAGPGSPAAPIVNDTTLPKPAKPGILDRARGVASRLRPAATEAAAAGETAAAAAPAAARGILGRVRGLAGGTLAKIAAPVATAAAVSDSMQPDATARYAKRFGVSEPSGDGSMSDMLKFAALRAGGFASDLGNDLTGGLAGNLYRDQPNAPATALNAAAAPAAAAPAAGAPAQPGSTQTDLSKLIDDKTFIPQAGTGLIRNDTTGLTQEIGGQASPEAPASATPGDGQTAVRMPDASLLLNSGTVGKYLTGATDAANATIGNAEEGKGIVRRKGRAEARKSEAEAAGAERLDQVTNELIGLNDSNDPGGARRMQLRDLALTLSGHAQTNTTDTPRDRYLRSLTKSALTNAVTPEDRAAAQKYIDEEMQKYDGVKAAPSAATGNFQEGKVYVDAKGNRAMLQNGKWVAA